MATRQVLAELAQAWMAAGGPTVVIESVGGVDAARRVQSGEPFDMVLLASDAIDRLIASGHVTGARTDWVRSSVGVAVPEGAPLPDIGSASALRAAVLAAPSIGYSTGPSGTALLKRFEQWGIAGDMAGRIHQAPPGVPVASMVARRDVALGFQQLSELIGVAGVTVVGTLPPEAAITTIFSAGVCAGTTQGDAVRAWLDFLNSPQAAPVKRRHGMEPA